MIYPTDLTDSQWEVVQKIIPDTRRRKHSIRIIFNALFYVVKTGCQWRMLPSDMPSWKLVHYYFRKWTQDGTIELLHDQLAAQKRIKARKRAEPTAAIIDAQSVKTTAVSSRHSGFDAGKKVKGRKRHLLVDTLGLIICCVVHSAGIQDRDGAKILLRAARDRLLKVVWADSGYWSHKLINWVKERLGWPLKIVHKEQKQFKVSARRWIVERTFGWLSNDRRLSKDYERLTHSSEAYIYLAMTKLMIKH